MLLRTKLSAAKDKEPAVSSTTLASPVRKFISMNTPYVIVYYDRDVSLALAEVKDPQDRPTQYIGHLFQKEAERSFAGFIHVCPKRMPDLETVVSEKIGSLTIQQKLFAFPYGDIDGDEKTILCSEASKV